MYESTFRLQRRPFSATPDPSCIYLPQSVQTVIDEIVVCLERGEGIAVLTAPAGLGKTLICEKVKQELGSEFVTLHLRHSQFATPADLLRTLLTELGGVIGRTVTEQELRLELVSQLKVMRRQNQLLAVLCDEAHELCEPLLSELRRLVDHADHGTPWVRVLLCGQLELEERLAEPQLTALNQRLRSHVTLSPLTAQEAWDFIDYRITWAGGRTEEVFTTEALSAIIEAADGIPRCLNQLCDHTLLLSYVADRRPAPAELVREALEDLQHLPLSWNVRPSRTSPTPGEREPGNDEVETPAVEFGDHLASWDASSSEIWEFGSQDEDKGDHVPPGTDDVAGNSADEAPVIDPVGSFLQAVEDELTRIEKASQTISTPSSRMIEEPVLDRYAAIDAGWPTDDIPREANRWQVEEPKAEDTQILHRSDFGNASPPMPITAGRSSESAESSLEQQLSSQVLKLVASTHESLTGRRVDEGPMEVEAFGIETPSAAVTPGRPFRNLFTRLRRKQRGLE